MAAGWDVHKKSRAAVCAGDRVGSLERSGLLAIYRVGSSKCAVESVFGRSWWPEGDCKRMPVAALVNFLSIQLVGVKFWKM